MHVEWDLDRGFRFSSLFFSLFLFLLFFENERRVGYNYGVEWSGVE